MALSEGNYLNDLLKGEAESPVRFSREQITVLDGEELVMGSVIGKILSSTPTTGTADAENTGDGTCTGVTAGDDAQIGTYTLTCTAAATNGGTFAVKAPDGAALPDAAVGSAYANSQINFTINDGDTDFAAGDIFTIAVAAGSGKCVEIDFSAVDGSQKAYGFAIDEYDATAGDVQGVAIVRDATIVADYLTWPTGATADQKTAALAQLAERGIIERTEV